MSFHAWNISQFWIYRYICERRVCRYQRGNQNPYIEEEQTTQWPKENGQKDKQLSLKIQWLVYMFSCNLVQYVGFLYICVVSSFIRFLCCFGCRFDPKDYAIDICCFSAYYISLISKNNILLIWSKLTFQYRVTCSYMDCSISGLTLYKYNSTWCHIKQLLISSHHDIT